MLRPLTEGQVKVTWHFSYGMLFLSQVFSDSHSEPAVDYMAPRGSRRKHTEVASTTNKVANQYIIEDLVMIPDCLCQKYGKRIK